MSKTDTYLAGFDEDGMLVKLHFEPKAIPSEEEQRRTIEEYKARGKIVFWDDYGLRVVTDDEHAANMVPIFQNGRVITYINASQVAIPSCTPGSSE